MPVLLEEVHYEAQSSRSRGQHSRFRFARRLPLSRIHFQDSEVPSSSSSSFFEKNQISKKGKKKFILSYYIWMRFELSLGCKQAIRR